MLMPCFLSLFFTAFLHPLLLPFLFSFPSLFLLLSSPFLHLLGEHLRICAQGYTCCTSDVEDNLAMLSRREMEGLLREAGRSLQTSLNGHYKAFDSEFAYCQWVYEWAIQEKKNTNRCVNMCVHCSSLTVISSDPVLSVCVLVLIGHCFASCGFTKVHAHRLTISKGDKLKAFYHTVCRLMQSIDLLSCFNRQ